MKAILVVDIPDKHNIEEIRVDIQANSYGEEILDWRNQTLIPMPQKREFADENKIYKAGWNDCIDEILGETE